MNCQVSDKEDDPCGVSVLKVLDPAQRSSVCEKV